MSGPEIGEPAPELVLNDSEGRRFQLSDHRGSFVVLFFYPMDDTMVCTAQNVCFTRNYDEFEELGAVVVGVGGGGAESKPASAVATPASPATR
jgi:peroxiredoxin Q/BCP